MCGQLCHIQLDCRILWSSMCLEGINWYHIFCMEMTISRRKDLILPLLVVCNQMYLLFNQIAGFFDHHYLWMGSINTLEYLHWGNHQQKEGFETSSLVWVWPVAFLCPVRLQGSPRCYFLVMTNFFNKKAKISIDSFQKSCWSKHPASLLNEMLNSPHPTKVVASDTAFL